MADRNGPVPSHPTLGARRATLATVTAALLAVLTAACQESAKPATTPIGAITDDEFIGNDAGKTVTVRAVVRRELGPAADRLIPDRLHATAISSPG